MGCMRARGMPASNDDSGVDGMRQHQIIGNRLEQYLRKRLRGRGPHLGSRIGVERLGKRVPPGFFAGPLRITVPNAVIAAVEA